MPLCRSQVFEGFNTKTSVEGSSAFHSHNTYYANYSQSLSQKRKLNRVDRLYLTPRNHMHTISDAEPNDLPDNRQFMERGEH